MWSALCCIWMPRRSSPAKSCTSTAAKAPATDRSGAPEVGAPGSQPGQLSQTSYMEVRMPIVTIQVTREGSKPGNDSVTADEKAALIKGASQLLLDVLNKPLEATFVVIQEVDTENWGWGGLPVEAYRKQRGLKAD